MKPIDLGDAFNSFDEQWSPRLAATLNRQAVKLEGRGRVRLAQP